MVAVQSFLIGPFVNQKETVRIIGRKEIFIADATFHGADAVSNTTLFHFFIVLPGTSVLTGIADIDSDLLGVGWPGNKHEQCNQYRKNVYLMHNHNN